METPPQIWGCFGCGNSKDPPGTQRIWWHPTAALSAHGSWLDSGSAGMLQAENFSSSHDAPELDREAMLLLVVPLLHAKASGAFTRFWELALALGVSPGLSQGLMSVPVVEAWFRCEFL